MTLIVSYFLNTGAKTRWCRSRGASASIDIRARSNIYAARIEKTIKIEQAHEVVSVVRAHDYAPANIFYIIFLLLDCMHCDDKAPSDDN